MSTFRGVAAEFPQLRFDYFRYDSSHPPPLACFLSHVHSDHLQGLESLKAPFVYCSPATKEILLRLEKYPHRLNFARNILEARVQTYRHLKSLLKSIPLSTPTVIELAPGRSVRVTLLDANHCIGAVMFLVENAFNAILYTGDIRAETWWVNSIVREPSMIKYASGIRKLDCIYLDTTFATKTNMYRTFPSKAEGTMELLRKIERYPKGTVFHFQSWTFGYEDVWVALSNFLESPVHVDRYRWTLYNSLSRIRPPDCQAPETSGLIGFQLGNHRQQGVLTQDTSSQLHSCEWYSKCPAVSKGKDFVRVVPIVSRTETGVEIREEGAGGGKGDLDPAHELELDANILGRVLQACAQQVTNQEVLARIASMLGSSLGDRLKLDSEMIAKFSEDVTKDPDELPLQTFVEALIKLASKQTNLINEPTSLDPSNWQETINVLPKEIHFPYSRHSSYDELRHLVSALQPLDVYPCVIDESTWHPELSMAHLFADCLQNPVGYWRHDKLMYAHYRSQDKEVTLGSDLNQDDVHTQTTHGSDTSDEGMGMIEQKRAHALLSDNVPRKDETSGKDHTHPNIRAGSHESQCATTLPVNVHQTADSAVIIQLESGFNHPSVPPSSNYPLPGSLPPDSTAKSIQAVTSINDVSEQLFRPEFEPSELRNRSISRWAEIMAKGYQGFEWSDFGGLECLQNTGPEREEEDLGVL